MERKEGVKTKGIFSLFSGKELKSLFRKYLISIVIIEIIIFMVCWLYQIGAAGYDRFGPVDTPFPWKIYFLTAFLVPVGITFLFGLFIIAFENLFFGHGKKEKSQIVSESGSGRLKKIVGFFFQVPFLTFLLVIGVCAVLFYDFDLITGLVLNAGEGFSEILKILTAGICIGTTVIGLVWLFLQYKTKKKEMDLNYRLMIAEKTGVVCIDKDKVMEKNGKIVILSDKESDIIHEENESYLPGINGKEDN